jgi:PHD/YefM family antitoxin component YafN of YafNO toxin-antitoxin module
MSRAVRFLKDRHGEKVAVVIKMKEYERLMKEIEELEDIRAFDAAKASGEKLIPYEKVRSRILRRRK